MGVAATTTLIIITNTTVEVEEMKKERKWMLNYLTIKKEKVFCCS